MDFGAFVTILPGKDGLVHVSQISNERVEKVSDKLKEGDIVKVKVLEVDLARKRISLTMKLDAKPAPAGERGANNTYRAPARGERAAPGRQAAPQTGGSAMADAFARLQAKR
jgi:uncharacterized protein